MLSFGEFNYELRDLVSLFDLLETGQWRHTQLGKLHFASKALNRHNPAYLLIVVDALPSMAAYPEDSNGSAIEKPQ